MSINDLIGDIGDIEDVELNELISITVDKHVLTDVSVAGGDVAFNCKGAALVSDLGEFYCPGSYPEYVIPIINFKQFVKGKQVAVNGVFTLKY